MPADVLLRHAHVFVLQRSTPLHVLGARIPPGVSLAGDPGEGGRVPQNLCNMFINDNTEKPKFSTFDDIHFINLFPT